MNNAKYVYIDNGIVEDVCAQVDEVLEELAFIRKEMARAKCKRCKAYAELVMDLTNTELEYQKMLKVLDDVIPF